MFHLSLEGFITHWNLVHLIALCCQLSDGLKRTYTFIDYLPFLMVRVGSVFSCGSLYPKWKWKSLVNFSKGTIYRNAYSIQA